MLPKSVGSKTEREPQQARLCVIPIDQAIAAAVTANTMISDPWEQQAVYAASLMSPCGIFLAEQPVNQLERGDDSLLEHRASLRRVLLLERPLGGLMNQSKEKCRLMRYLLDQPGQDQVVPATWLHMRQCLQRGQVQIQCIW